MKKILSLLLALLLVMGLAACGTDQPSAQQPPAAEVVPEGTTLPLYWPPLPEETTAPAEQPGDTIQPDDRETEPVVTQPQTTEPVATKPTEPKPTQPPETQPTQPPETEPTQPPTTKPAAGYIDPNGTYDSKKDVALYIHLYGRLPSNYITKKQAEALGWSGGSVERYAPGKCIGGDRFYNNEGLLPRGHTYYECDIGTLGKSSRGAQRIVFTYDGLVYYTSNHYKSFTLLYGEP